MPETETAPSLDDETTAALTLFNEYVDADRARTRREKQVKKAEQAKDEAAARVKKLQSGGSAEEKAEAEAAYKEATEAWRRIRDGEEPAPKAETAKPAEQAAEAESDAPAEQAGEAESDAPAEQAGEAESDAPAEQPEASVTDRTDDDAEDAADTADADSADEAE